MPAVRHARLLPVLLLAAAGCAQSGAKVAPRTSLGSLKTSLSHLEYENQQLKKKVASLEGDNRQIEHELTQERTANGDLSRRLDDARNLLSHRGLDPGGPEADLGARAQALPAGRTSRARRKPPFAQIPGRIDVLPPSDDERDPAADGAWGPAAPTTTEPGPTSQADRSTLWLPVARGATEPPRKTR